MKAIFDSPTIQLSKLIWKTMCSISAHSNYLKARYRKNETNGSRYADSLLIHKLRDNAWVPQNNIFVKPSAASRDLLPDGFTFDSEWEWLKAVNFGDEAEKKSEENRQKQELAKKSGFGDLATYERAKRFAALPPDEQEKFLDELEHRNKPELPENQSSNPERRAKNIGKQAENDLDKTTEKRTRSVSVGRDDVKKEAEQYLKNQYTNPDGIMICQICKDVLPFKLDDDYYFEKVELFREINKHHHQNFLALCPNHSAMFQYANGSKDIQFDMFKELGTNEFEIVLAQKDMSIYFTTNHRCDLQTILNQPESSDDDEE